MKFGNGLYKTKNGSTVIIMGEHSGISLIEFDWLEENNACIDCVPESYQQDGYLHWNCEHCGEQTAKLNPTLHLVDIIV